MKQNEDSLTKREVAEKYRKIVQIGASVGLLITILLVWFIATGTYFKPASEGGMFEVHLRQLGVFGPIIFMIIQVIQVVLPIIPGGAVTLSGTVVFGYVWGFVYNYTGIFIGSMIAFHLARRYGEFFVKCFISDESYDKYLGWTRNEKRFSWILGILFFLPAAPDDILCMIAGLTTMSFKKFVLIFIPTKAVSTFVFAWLQQEVLTYFLNTLWPNIVDFWTHLF
ncbi:TVP38/TMEM64 family protein [Granulicatella sp. 19428wC4_WM01]|nr:TVP38/TMEM64 family protein [Granulicatella sp. 19428wC4_WM01]TFU93539.1 TVP38/TMEM64 family protein [Granulicatella sp. WM01]